jgi:hypothetical protein
MANFHFREADELPKSERGKNGFGSTGKKWGFDHYGWNLCDFGWWTNR